MPKLHDLRTDFSRGRTGDALRAHVDTKSYGSSVYEAENWMVLSDGSAARRWGTKRLLDLDALGLGECRIESWTFDVTDTKRFLLVFSDATMTIYDMTLTQVYQAAGQPWTAETMWFLTMAGNGARLVIADASFQTRILTLDPTALTFSMRKFAFSTSSNGLRLEAPFYHFGNSDTVCTSTIFTSAGEENGYGPAIVQALNIPSTSFDLDLGTGSIETNISYFNGFVSGDRIRIGSGEVEIVSVVSDTKANVKVIRDIGIRLDSDPFFIRKGSTRVEVYAADHGLQVGDGVFFCGLSRETADRAGTVLTNAAYAPDDTNGVTSASGTFATYTIKRVIDDNRFEIIGGASVSEPNQLHGGEDVYIIPTSGIRGVTEPVYSARRGWPQSTCFHEQRLWLAGSSQLPDAIFASRTAEDEDFDPGDGSANDALTLYGIGDQSSVRHMLSNFDLAILTSSGCYYVAGSTDQAITPETVAAPKATENGASYTRPFLFDSGIFYMDAAGKNLREMNIQQSGSGYITPPVSTVIPDWVDGQKQCSYFEGSRTNVTPYLVWCNGTAGDLVVMLSSRKDEAFGFMRWAIDGATFLSVSGVGSRLFAVVKKDGKHLLVEFDTSESYTTVDLSVTLTSAVATTSWSAPELAGLSQSVHSGLQQFSDVEIDQSGGFSINDARTEVTVGYAMPHLLELHAPRAASGQGSKAGKKQRLISAHFLWADTTAGLVNGEQVLNELDFPALQAPTPVNEWRQYWIGEWGTEPRARVDGSGIGRMKIRGCVLNVYF